MSPERHQRFQQLLLDYSREPDTARRAALEQSVWDEFGAERAVMVADMSGFSRLTLKHGIVHYLSMVRRMQVTATPILAGWHGELVKFEADNLYAVFPDAAAAVHCAIALNHAFDAANLTTPDELDIRLSCGIAQGPILLLAGDDFFGHAVNVASKLGEDVADPGQILIHADALAALASEPMIRHEMRHYDISGLDLVAAEVIYRA
jgi:class 3 adenylate cyclase